MQLIRISPSVFFSFAFFPFIGGALIHDYSGSEYLAWFSTVGFLGICLYLLYRGLSFQKKTGKAFLFFTVLSLILSLLASYFGLLLEGVQTFSEVKEFHALPGKYSDLIGMGPVGSLFKDIAQNDGLIEALRFPWLAGHYNNLLSPFKYGFALWALPSIGYYSWAVISWWFCIIFYVIALHMYHLSKNNNQENNCFYVCLSAWLILPFALHIDREAIAVVLIGIIAFGISFTDRFSVCDWISMILSVVLLSIHRVAYFIFPFVIIPFVIWSQLRQSFRIERFQYMSKNVALFIVGIFLVLSGYFMSVFNMFLPYLNTDERFVYQILSMEGEAQDLWNQFRLGIPVLDDALKLAFLSLTPFPYYQMFKADDGWALIVPARLISLNVFPIFMIGKLIVVVLVVRRLAKGVTYSPELFLLSILFLLPVLSSIRTGPAYLIPSLSIFVLWLTKNGLNKRLFIEGLKITLVVAVVAHFIYIGVYGKL